MAIGHINPSEAFLINKSLTLDNVASMLGGTKFCIECSHCDTIGLPGTKVSNIEDILCDCGYDHADLVRGVVYVKKEKCILMRSHQSLCGVEGNWWDSRKKVAESD
jgi:hypothetical protein